MTIQKLVGILKILSGVLLFTLIIYIPNGLKNKNTSIKAETNFKYSILFKDAANCEDLGNGWYRFCYYSDWFLYHKGSNSECMIRLNIN